MPANMDPMSMQMAMQLEMMKMMRDMQADRVRTGRNGDSDDDEGDGRGKDTKAFGGVHRSRKRFEMKPNLILEEYVQRVQRDLGVVHASQFWVLTDHSRRIKAQFGRMHGLWRCHHGIAELVQHFLEGRVQHAAAYGALLLQALHQVALDQGDWSNAVHILPSPDPLGRAEFGAGETAMSEIAAYRRALKELKKKHGGSEGPADTEEEAERPAARRPKAKAK